MSKYHIYWPLLLVAIIISLGLYQLSQSVIPLSEARFRDKVTAMASSAFMAELKSGEFFTELPNITLFADEVFEGGKLLENVFIHIDRPNLKRERVIFAKSGHLLRENAEGQQSSSLELLLNQGNILDQNLQTGKTEKILFESYRFPIVGGRSGELGRLRPSSLTTTQLRELVSLGEQKLKEQQLSPKIIGKIFFEYFNRLNLPFVCLIFSLFGFSYGVYNVRSQRRNPVVSALITLIIYYASYYGLVSLARSQVSWMPLAIFGPTALLFIWCFYRFQKTDWA